MIGRQRALLNGPAVGSGEFTVNLRTYVLMRRGGFGLFFAN